MADRDYENKQKKLQELWDSMMSDEEQSLYGDVYESDEHQPSDSSSSSSVDYLPEKRRKQEPKAGPSGEQRTKNTVEKEETNKEDSTNESSHFDEEAENNDSLRQISANVDEIIEEVIRQFAGQDDDNENGVGPSWYNVDGSHLKNIDFTVRNTGIKADLYNMFNNNPYDFFKLFITDDIIAYIVDQTNIYAAQSLGQNQQNNRAKNSKKTKAWAPTDSQEMEKFFGIILWMGLLGAPTFRSYWSKNFMYKNNIPTIMSRNRFEQLLKMWHFSNNEDPLLENDRLRKISPLLERLLVRFQDSIVPDRDVCIDESIVPFRGRLRFRQYIKNKRHKFGIKLYKLCTKGGYTYNVRIYCGADHQEDGGSASSHVVMQLMENLLDTGRILCTDNFYTSVTLASKLLERNTHLIGTVAARRKFNSAGVISKKLRKGEVISRESNTGIMMLKWRDKRDVLMLSTIHTDGMGKINNARGQEVEKPQVIIDYNKSKAYIDLSDQLKSYSTCLKRGTKWYRKLAYELIFGSALVNAFIIYREVTQEKIKITEFKERLAMRLLGVEILEEQSEAGEHILTATERRSVRCVVCYANTKNLSGRLAAQKCRRSQYECSACKKHYCVECFFSCHTAQKK